jgi:hypothetical protein
MSENAEEISAAETSISPLALAGYASLLRRGEIEMDSGFSGGVGVVMA